MNDKDAKKIVTAILNEFSIKVTKTRMNQLVKKVHDNITQYDYKVKTFEVAGRRFTEAVAVPKKKAKK